MAATALRLIFTIVLFSSIGGLAADAIAGGTHYWSRRYGDVNFQRVWDIVADRNGEFTITGSFEGNVNFGGGVVSSGPYGAAFLAHYEDVSAVNLWTKSFPDSASALGRALATDTLNNVWLVGQFNERINFGLGPMGSGSGPHIFIAKFNSLGSAVGALVFQDNGTSFLTADDIVIDASGNAIMTGLYSGTIDFGGGPMTTAGGDDIYVVKFDANGIHQWSKSYGDTDFSFGAALATSGDDVIIVSTSPGTLDFGGGPLTSAGDHDIFVARLDALGNHKWSKRFGDVDFDGSGRPLVDKFGNIMMTALYDGSIDFGGGALPTSTGVFDGAVVRLTGGGTHLHSQGFGGPGGSILALDLSGNIFVAGYSDGTVDFGGGPLAGSGNDLFIAKLDPTFGHLWSCVYTSPSLLGTLAMIVGSSDFTITGTYEGSIDMGGGALTSAGGRDIFMANIDNGATATAIAEPAITPTIGATASPNPFGSSTTIRYSLTEPGRVTAAVYDARGRLVGMLMDNVPKAAGSHTLEYSSAGAPGVYFVRIQAGDVSSTSKIVHVR